jgi:prepilin-type N-terminal cleavage/methylation domain-containing protein
VGAGFSTSGCTRPTGQRGFTMIEIALCLAIIGFALLSILLVLPKGMDTQRETREQTIINDDASMLLEAIRSGSRGADDLTNYVYAITNYITEYNSDGTVRGSYVAGYTPTAASLSGSRPGMLLTNGLRIVGLLSTPEFTDTVIGPPFTGGAPISSIFGRAYTSNYIVAYVRSLSGLAAEKPPQDNAVMQGASFGYQIRCVNALGSLAQDTNTLNSAIGSAYERQLAGNLRELRLLFMWPQLPNGKVGNFRQNFRVSVAGQLVVTNYGSYFPNIDSLYFYDSQSFTNNP